MEIKNNTFKGFGLYCSKVIDFDSEKGYKLDHYIESIVKLKKVYFFLEFSSSGCEQSKYYDTFEEAFLVASKAYNTSPIMSGVIEYE